MEKKLTIGIAFNPVDPNSDHPIQEEYASARTIESMTSALEDTGSRIIHIVADMGAFERFEGLQDELDLVFNIAEGVPEMDSRKTAIAKMLDQLGIHYTGSNASAHNIGGNKNLARKALGEKIPHPNWWLFEKSDQKICEGITYPLFVKPATEGSSIGISQEGVVTSESQLRRVLRYIIDDMGLPAIVEDFLDGREYNIGLIGNVIFPALGWDLDSLPGAPKVRDPNVKTFDIGYSQGVESDIIHRALARYAAIAHNGVGARDYSRSDFRAMKRAEPLFMEINIVPGLNPEKSDLPHAAGLAGAQYKDIVASVAYAAMQRILEDNRYEGALTGKDIDGFRHSYEALVGLADNSEPLIVDGRSYHVLKCRR